MRANHRRASALAITLLTILCARPTWADTPVYSPNMIATVTDLMRVKILQSNNVTLRPGSVYDNLTYFESLLDFPQPGFNYEFRDSGLGAAEPLYPMYQKGYQFSWLQLLPGFFSNTARHIDHFSSLNTPEGCKVDSMYLLRDLNEYPPTAFITERTEGYQMIVVRLEYYTRLTKDAQCGRHRTNDPDPNFDPVAYMLQYHNAMSLADFPQAPIPRFEAKVAAIYPVVETLNQKFRRFDLNNLNQNYLYFYPNGHDVDYGVNTPRPQPGLKSFNLPRHMVIPATPQMQAALPLSALISSDQFQMLVNFWNGKPTPDFDPSTEPGHDTLQLSDVTPNNIYNAGLYMENIQTVSADVTNPANFRLISMAIKPYELQDDISWQGLRVVPQVRFIYQMVDPRDPTRLFEQLNVHLKWDVVDRLADPATQKAQHLNFLARVDALTEARESGAANFQALLNQFIADFTSARPIESINFSSSLTGIRVFGSIARDYNKSRQLQAVDIVRDGVDVGYYSSTFDEDVFRTALAKATGARQTQLQQHLDDLTVDYFRDPKRQDATAINFNRVTCAQCHQTSARDGVHMATNDGVDRRFTAPINVSEYFFHDADLQLVTGMTYWLNH